MFELAQANLKQIAQMLADTEDMILVGKLKDARINLDDLDNMMELGEEQVHQLEAFLDKILEKETAQRAEVTQMKEELGFKLYALESLEYSYQSEKELQEIIQRALDTLPERCREVFIKRRIEGLKYKEISEELGISVNTVENHIVTALKKLRVALKDYLPLLLFLVN